MRHPQGLKPDRHGWLNGTAKAVPFHKPFAESAAEAVPFHRGFAKEEQR
jgi:hypothetical protein